MPPQPDSFLLYCSAKVLFFIHNASVSYLKLLLTEIVFFPEFSIAFPHRHANDKGILGGQKSFCFFWKDFVFPRRPVLCGFSSLSSIVNLSQSSLLFSIRLLSAGYFPRNLCVFLLSFFLFFFQFPVFHPAPCSPMF